MPGTTSGGKSERISVTPASITVLGSTVGASAGRLVKRMLSRSDWAIARAREVPTLKLTVGEMSGSSPLLQDGGMVYSHRSIAVVDGRSSGRQRAWPAMMARGRPVPNASPASAW